jgi:SHS2 domain-containing protein
MDLVEPRPSARAGHRLAPHVADVALEAWASTHVACLEETVLALVESFADIGDVTPTDCVAISVDAEGDEDVLVSLLEEVIYTIDVDGAVPVAVALSERAGGGVEGFLATVLSEQPEVVGALPKGVSRSDLHFARGDGEWRGQVLVDV